MEDSRFHNIILTNINTTNDMKIIRRIRVCITQAKTDKSKIRLFDAAIRIAHHMWEQYLGYKE